MKYLVIFISICISILSHGQERETITINKIDTLESFYGQYVIDESRFKSFDEIKSKKFTSGKYPINSEATYWFKFKLKLEQKADLLLILIELCDEAEVYAPYPKSYKTFEMGVLKKGSRIIDNTIETNTVSINCDSIDFNKPFYIKTKPISDWGIMSLGLPIAAVTTNDKYFIVNETKNAISFYRMITFYTIIILTSFVIFLINFFISKNYNYLNYSLYLFFVSLMLVVRIPYFYNALNEIHPKLFYYLRIISITVSSGLYFYFIIIFLNFKEKYTKVYKISIFAFRGILLFTIIYILLIVLFPFLPYRFLMLMLFKVGFTLLSIGVFIFLLFQKGNIIFNVALISSLLLIVGNVLSIVTGSASYFFNISLIEIIIFFCIVSYNNKLIIKEKIKSEFELEKEKNEKQNLLELDKFKSNFFTNISHEFRTPLTLISGPIEKQLERKNLSKEDRFDLSLIKQNASRLLDLVNQMMDYTLVESGHLSLKITKGNLSVLLQQLITVFKYKAQEEKVSIQADIQVVENVYFDRDIVEKVVSNLLSNAIKYSLKNSVITFNSLTKNGFFILSIINEYKDVEIKKLNKLFQRFYQENEFSDGIGIGLALVKELVELSNGTIVANTIDKNKIQFMVTLPIEKNAFLESDLIVDDVKSSTDNQQVKLVPSTQNKLLIVEDNKEVRDFIVTIFKNKYKISVAKNGKEGVEIAKKILPEIIISDVMMPIIDGIELCATIKQDKLTSHIPIILLTAKVGEDNRVEGLKIGADVYITKPFSKKRLVIEVERLINNRLMLKERYSNEFTIESDLAITSTETEFLNQLKEILETHVTNPEFTSEQLSKLLLMSRAQLHRKLKAIYELSTSEFIRSQRLKLSLPLLKESDATISEIAYQVGFNSPSYFIKCFKKTYKSTPKKYIKSFI